jgi:chemotaxis protein CheZ
MPEAAKAVEADETFARDHVVRIVNSVLEKAYASEGGVKEILCLELQQLKELIEQTRQDVSHVRPGEISAKHIPSATDELDAVVSATAEATGVIMDSCEAIQNAMAGAEPARAAAVEGAVTKIFESCSFQDITGQRITKVVKTLKLIDEKITALLQALGGQGVAQAGPVEDARTGDQKLLNGPQLPGHGVTQADIDKILAEFGN